MRMTETIRDAFVGAILADTPRVEYGEQMQKVAQEYLLNAAPPAVVRLFKNPDTRHYFHQHAVRWTDDYSEYNTTSCFVVPNEGHSNYFRITDPETVKKLSELGAAERQQNRERRELKGKLEATIKGFTTVKSARDAMPELAKYLPDPTIKVDRTVPAVTGLITDLVKAGWPDKKKGGKKVSVLQTLTRRKASDTPAPSKPS